MARSAQELRERANKIFKQFISDESPEQVNLSAKVKREIEENMAKNPIDRRCFASAEREILSLIVRSFGCCLVGVRISAQSMSGVACCRRLIPLVDSNRAICSG